MGRWNELIERWRSSARGTAREEGPGNRFVGSFGLLFGLVYMVAVAVLLLYGLFTIWPHPTPAMVPRQPAADTILVTEEPLADDTSRALPAGGAQAGRRTAAPLPDTIPGYAWCLEPDSLYTIVFGRDTRQQANDPKCARFLGWTFTLWDEQRLLLIVMLSGALGSLLHGLRSFGWYAGNRTLKWSWAPFYIVLPFTGAVLGFLFYVIVRGGFFAPGSGFSDTSPFGFASLAALVGLFSAQAIVKLQQVAETLLAKPDSGKDAAPQGAAPSGEPLPVEGSAPAVSATEVVRATPDRPTDELHVRGTGFERDAVVRVEGEPRPTRFISGSELACTLVKGDLERLDAGDTLAVVVENAPGSRSTPVTVG